MTTTAEIVRAAMALPEAERLAIAKQLSDSVAPPGVMREGAPEFFEELDRRVEEYKRDPSTAVEWEVVRAALEKKFGRGVSG